MYKSSAPSFTIDELIQSDAVPRLVEFLVIDDFPQRQFFAAWILAYIAGGTSENTKLRSPSVAVRHEASWALGNVACDSPSCRDLVLSHGAMIPLLSHLNELTDISMLRVATRTLSNFCMGKPQPLFEQLTPALPTLERLIFFQ
ncbi:hypothetical protein MtrunA17_Chr4g0004931 [Medicago truncatula]|uniref:Uncharacterized protein n=1 Tax=Medicago truncatula TaxID=3880 RepID=A0A396I758_MEDTR|nr:hypothetical protein MtrunA17_Chr4g0004931 [Medicago truncatula]